MSPSHDDVHRRIRSLQAKMGDVGLIVSAISSSRRHDRFDLADLSSQADRLQVAITELGDAANQLTATVDEVLAEREATP